MGKIKIIVYKKCCNHVHCIPISKKQVLSNTLFILQRHAHPMFKFMFYYSCSSERIVLGEKKKQTTHSTYSRTERSCTIVLLSFSTALNSNYGQNRKIFISFQYVMLPPERTRCTLAFLLYELLL